MDTINQPQLLLESILAAVHAEAFDDARQTLVEHDTAVREAVTTNAYSHEAMARLLVVQRQLMAALAEKREAVSVQLHELGRTSRGARAYLEQDPP